MVFFPCSPFWPVENSAGKYCQRRFKSARGGIPWLSSLQTLGEVRRSQIQYFDLELPIQWVISTQVKSGPLLAVHRRREPVCRPLAGRVFGRAAHLELRKVAQISRASRFGGRRRKTHYAAREHHVVSAARVFGCQHEAQAQNDALFREPVGLHPELGAAVTRVDHDQVPSCVSSDGRTF